MAPEELREVAKHSPFEPFRVVMTNGAAHEIRHPDLIMIGRRSAMIGMTGQPGQTFYEQTVRVDLLHVIRIEPLEGQPASPKNGMN
jgi:hypothetical protein